VDEPQVDVSAYFSTLGRAVSQAWSAVGRRDGALPDVAERILAEVDVPSGLNALSILEWAAAAVDLPPQSRRSDPFGQPPLVLHHEEDFFIQALTWMEGTTAIHDHCFCGAFMVLQGTSLHVAHSFDLADRLAEDHLVVGELVPVQPEVLRPLDIRRIEPGEHFIHALFHLERPTVTVVVRNGSCDLPYPQYTYLRPGLGWHSLWEDRSWSKRLQSIHALVVLDPAAGLQTIRELIAGRATIWEAFLLVEYWSSNHWWDDIAVNLADRLVTRAGALNGVLPSALKQEIRVRKILIRRGMLHTLHHRVLLALLANLPDASSITTILQQLFPGQVPGALLLEWVEELSAPDLRGISGLTFPASRLDEFRASPLDGREQELLAEIRAAWGEPKDLTGLHH
jgi:hypothetical protein